ncbi:hypothetical protein [Chryseobacterium sp.]|uniref:hypothetical protein n=1 Tax=Chryseobacterium sp. TaxID=1871047 RepID=UPI002FCAD507
MKKYFLILTLLGYSCSGWKKELVEKESDEIAFKNAIVDFCNTSSLVKKDNVFSISFKEYSSKAIGISIMGNVNNIYIYQNSPQSRIPDQYIEYNNKLFCWYDDKKNKNPNIIKKLSEYKVIDSVKVLTEDMGYIRDDAKKGVNYYFCKDNLLIFKKEETSFALPREIKIDLNCTQ